MEKMTWEMFLPLVIRHGVQFAYTFWANIKSKKEPTEEDWQVLLGVANKTADDYLMEAIRRLNPTPGTESTGVPTGPIPNP